MLFRSRVADALRRRGAEPPSIPLDNPDAFPAPDAALDEDWIEAVREEALRRLRDSVSPEHFAVFQASVLEELPTEDVMRLYRVTRDNLYQIRKRVKDAFAAHLRAALEELDAPLPPE